MAEDYFIAKVYRQHRSLCVAVPRPVCIAMGIKAGQYMIFSWNQGDGRFNLKKFIPPGAKDGKDERNPDREDQGGGA